MLCTQVRENIEHGQPWLRLVSYYNTNNVNKLMHFLVISHYKITQYLIILIFYQSIIATDSCHIQCSLEKDYILFLITRFVITKLYNIFFLNYEYQSFY